jgi:hypothetical protein
VKWGRTGTYAWRETSGDGGRACYSQQAADLRAVERVAQSLEVATNGLRRAAGPHLRNHPCYLSGWWEWTAGSTPFFWNWPSRYQEEVRDGQRHFLTGEFGRFDRPQPSPRVKEEGELARAKLVQVRRQNYIETGPVTSLIHYFYVPKGTSDI